MITLCSFSYVVFTSPHLEQSIHEVDTISLNDILPNSGLNLAFRSFRCVLVRERERERESERECIFWHRSVPKSTVFNASYEIVSMAKFFIKSGCSYRAV